MPYEENDHPRQGAVRASFHKNVLLAKPRLGQSKEVATNLPDKDWIYGMCNEYDLEGAREVMRHKDNVPDDERKRGPDILSMNKLAAIRNVTNASQQRQFRKKHLIRLHISRRVGKSPGAKLPSEVDPNYIYGRPGEPSENMWKVMKNGYSNEWVKMNQQHQHVFQENEFNFKCPTWNNSAMLKYKETNNKLRTPTVKDRFIISRFRNVPKKIDNYNPTPLKRD